jgi:hypothetical protein
MLIIPILAAALLAQVPAPNRPKPVSVIKAMPPAGYRFIEVAHTKDTYQEFLGAPTLNGMGMTAFTSVMDSGNMIVAYGSGGPIQIVASTPERFTRFEPTPLINDSWDVVFVGHVADQGSGLFIKSLGRDPLIIGDTLLMFSRFQGVPDINSRSEVAFYAEIDPRIPPGPIEEDQRPKSFPDLKASDAEPAPGETPGMGLFVNGLLETTVAVDTLRSFRKVEPVVSIAENGQVAFVATTRIGIKGVYVQTPGVVMPYPIVNDEIKYADFGRPVLTDEGQLCFWAKMKNGTEAILLTRGDGGQIRELVHTELGIPMTFDPTVSFTDSGSLLYIARDKDGPVLYLTQRLGAPLRIVGAGTQLCGSTVKDVFISHRSLNAVGQLCFHAKLEDGEAVIILATPKQ